MSTDDEAVAKGAAFLDEHDPGWWRTDNGRPINLGELDMGSPDRCILGQRCPLEVLSHRYPRDVDRGRAYFAFAEALSGLNVTDVDDWAMDLGFTLPSQAPGYMWDALAAEWARVITERRALVAA